MGAAQLLRLLLLRAAFGGQRFRQATLDRLSEEGQGRDRQSEAMAVAVDGDRKGAFAGVHDMDGGDTPIHCELQGRPTKAGAAHAALPCEDLSGSGFRPTRTALMRRSRSGWREKLPV